MPTASVWDQGRWAHQLEVTLDFMTHYIMEHVFAVVSPKGKTILELGSGTGRLSYLMLQAGARKVTMVDSSQKAVWLSRSLFADVDPAYYHIVPLDIFEYTPDERFEIVISSGLIEHFQGPMRAAILKAHVDHAQAECVLVYPSHRLYNRMFDRTPMARRLYGFAQTYPEDELDGYLRSLARVRTVRSKRFHIFYTIPVLHNNERLNRLFSDTFLERSGGGLSITYVQVEP
jgi:2-polyprenyl-3-methyl-5-hydroxy-6-metoxy-1,4-benzoquinol methylase